MNSVAVVPIKDFWRAKTRLAPVLAPTERQRLARQMAGHVIMRLVQWLGPERVRVAADGPRIARWAESRGCQAWLDPPFSGRSLGAGGVASAEGAQSRLGTVVDCALTQAAAAGFHWAWVIMADLPALSPEDLSALEAARAGGADCVVAPDRCGEGTNALGLKLPATEPTAFGQKGSGVAHGQNCGESDRLIRVVQRSGLGLDVDHPTDLEAAEIPLAGLGCVAR